MVEKVAVIDYGIGNVFSVKRALERVGVEVVLTGEAKEILSASKVILPGVGAFGRAAAKLRDAGLDRVIYDYIDTGKPFLGICVGMQLLMETGEEFGSYRGLGIIPGVVRRIVAHDSGGIQCRIPLIGWTSIREARPGAWKGTPFFGDGMKNTYYFVHSYQAEPVDPIHCIATHTLGDTEIVAAVRRENVYGVQFHPERSAEAGNLFLRDFILKN